MSVSTTISILCSFPYSTPPNGIVAIEDYLIVSLYGANELWKVSPITGESVLVTISPSLILNSGDGLRYDSDSKVGSCFRHLYGGVL